jgi:peptidoglycan-associated lipoprotein
MNSPAIRRHAVIAALAACLLALGACAANRPERGGIAPSRRAAQGLDDSSYYAPSDAAPTRGQKATPARSAVPVAAVTERGVPGGPAEERVAMEDPARGRRSAPLVPAFPAKLEQPRLRDLKTVYFDFDKAELGASTQRLLDANARWLKATPGARVRIEGHCDERGTSEYNLALGNRRAGRVRDYLVNLGVPPGAIVTVSYGAEMPLKAGHDESAWRWNRRVEFSPVEPERSAARSDPATQTGG